MPQIVSPKSLSINIVFLLSFVFVMPSATLAYNVLQLKEVAALEH
jgi:hypothetical protein